MEKNKKIEEVLRRNVVETIETDHLKQRLENGHKLRIKLGIDPTSPHIHIGRAVALWKLRSFQDLGHTIIFIVGDFTGLIGDTSDKESERPMLSENEVKKNMETYFTQVFKIIKKENTETYYNSEWLSKLGFSEIIKMASLFGLHEFEARENISKRLKAGKRVALQELLYPIMQGYDSVAVKSDVEIGGTDQKFNLLAGRTIQKSYKQEAQDILMTDLLEGTDGRKMSSSWGNVINITDTANDMFGKVMSINDNLIKKYFYLATNLSNEEIEEIMSNPNPKEQKEMLGRAIVSLYHGEKEAQKAQEEFKKVFSRGELPEEIQEYKIKNNKDLLIDIVVDSGLVSSKTEVKRLIKQNAISVDGKDITEWDVKITPGSVIKVGHKRFLKTM